MKAGIAIAVALLAVGAVVLLLVPSRGPAVEAEDADRVAGPGTSAPALREADRPQADERTGARERPPEGDVGTPGPTAAPAPPTVSGTVVDDETNEAVAGAAVWAEAPEERCPRLPRVDERRRVAPGSGAPGAAWAVRTDAAGAFTLPLGGPVASSDLFVRARGYVLASECAVRTGASVAVRLRRGRKVTGEVVGRDGRGIEGALVTAEPMPGVALVPGTRETATTDVDGRFTLDGLVRAQVVVTADHPRYVPASLEPMEPGGPAVRIVLVPAFLATFRLKTSDGSDPRNPSLAWKAGGRGLPAVEAVTLLEKRLADGEEAGSRGAGWTEYVPVKVPCDRGEALFQVKADACAPWTSAVEPLPADGGEKAYEVVLERDLSLGGLRVVLEDRDHKPLSFAGVDADARFARKDAVPIPAGIVMQPGEALVVPSIPAGSYVVYVRSPLHAPAAVPVDVVAGQQAEARAVMGPPAKLRVRFVASEAVIVKFRVLAGGELAYPYPEGTSTVAKTEDEGLPVFHAGADGLVLTGLGAGGHTIEVVSDDLAGTPVSVDLVEGETRDVEMTVVRR